jgi:predicted NBD/HSP70 family sugar kinase
MQEKADSELVRRQNRRVVLQTLRQHGPLPRVELGRITGLSPASITTIISQLISENILEELEQPFPLGASTRRGRPTVGVGLRPDAAYVMAVNISIAGVRLDVADFNGKVVRTTDAALNTYDAKQMTFGRDVAEAIIAFLTRLKLQPKQIARIGISLQGIADDKKGTISWSPAFSVKNIPLTAPMTERLGVPCHIANDANLIAEGYLAEDPANNMGTTACIFTGYGIGMGLIINGQVYHGATGGAAEFGHMNHIPNGAPCRCGQRGCLEAYAADYGIWRDVYGTPDDEAPRQAIDPAKMDALLKRAEAGDAVVVQAYKNAGEALGMGLARIVSVLNPHRIIIAGPGLNAAHIIKPALQQGFANGLIEEIRRNVSIELISFETDMILRGTIAALLKNVDADLAAQARGEIERASA